MKYSDIPADQKAQMQAFTDVFRPLNGSTARLFTQIQQMADAYSTSVQVILASLDDGEVVQTTTGLAGAAPLTKEEVVAMMGNFIAATTAFNTSEFRQAYIKAAGISSVMS